MELVYLWVEDYKNIHKQGFNFSPLFECEFKDKYDSEGKLKDNCELIINPKEHLKNFFGENINVTAIVGENGSGKSNLLDLILNLDEWVTTNNTLMFIAIKNKKIKVYLLNFTDKILCNKEVSQVHINRNKTKDSSCALSDIGFNFSYLSLSPFLHNINKFYSNGGITILSIYSYKEGVDNTTFNFNDFFLSLIPDIPKILKHNFVNSFFNINKKPKYLVFKISKYIKTLFQDEVEKILNASIEKRITRHSYIYQIDINNFSILNSLNILHEKIKEKKEHLSNEIVKLNQIEKKRFIPNINKQDIIDQVNLANGIRNNTKDKKKSKLEIELYKIQEIIFSFAGDNSSKEFHFSTGELVLLYYIKKLQDLNKCENDFTLCIDECELFLHPEWQKKFIKFLSKLFKDTNYNRQVIVSTHSPFILSDLPKENVIFLKKGVNITKDIDINPFGANIHTLLSHGFFMEDGLMGEFAKNKITKILNFLNGKNKFIDFPLSHIKPIIEKIGEDFLREKLLSIYNKKFPISKEEKIQELEKELKKLKDA